MASWDLPILPLPKDNNVPYVLICDNNQKYAVPSALYFKNLSGLLVPVGYDNPLPTRSIANNILDGTLNIATAGTPQLISTNQQCKTLLIKAKDTNTGIIKVGDSTPIFPLLAGDMISFDISNFNLIYIDATVSGEGIIWIAEI